MTEKEAKKAIQEKAEEARTNILIRTVERKIALELKHARELEQINKEIETLNDADWEEFVNLGGTECSAIKFRCAQAFAGGSTGCSTGGI